MVPFMVAGEQTVIQLYAEIQVLHLWDQHNVNLATGNGGIHGNVSTLPTHQLHNAYSIICTAGLQYIPPTQALFGMPAS